MVRKDYCAVWTIVAGKATASNVGYCVPGDNSGCPAVDQRGVARPQNGTCDMGAVEFGQPYFLPLLAKE